ncbi:MAG: hypothetical protein ABI914_03345 [Acidobacteriota bacterium]
MDELIDELLASSPLVRYVAVLQDGALTARARGDASGAATGRADEHEERLVVPGVLKLLSERQEVDRGGLRFLVARYGEFFRLVVPVRGGHVSILVETSMVPPEQVREATRIVSEWARRSAGRA